MTPYLIPVVSLLVLLCLSLVQAGLGLALTRAEIPEARKRKILLILPFLVTLWLFGTALLAKSGALSDWEARPPRLPFVPLIALVTLILLNRTAIFGKILDATPRHWPVALQTFRIGVELTFYGAFGAGLAPVQVTFEGRNFDILVGLTAPLVALAIAKKNLSPRLVIAWNILGVLILGNTIVTVLTSLPGAIHLDWPGEPFTELAAWPLIWIPAFLAPLALFLHLFSIRQNIRLAKNS